MRPRFSDRRDNARPLDLLAAKKLRFQGCMARGGDR
jgi:hypothetical protein